MKWFRKSIESSQLKGKARESYKIGFEQCSRTKLRQPEFDSTGDCLLRSYNSEYHKVGLHDSGQHIAQKSLGRVGTGPLTAKNDNVGLQTINGRRSLQADMPRIKCGPRGLEQELFTCGSFLHMPCHVSYIASSIDPHFSSTYSSADGTRTGNLMCGAQSVTLGLSRNVQ